MAYPNRSDCWVPRTIALKHQLAMLFIKTVFCTKHLGRGIQRRPFDFSSGSTPRVRQRVPQDVTVSNTLVQPYRNGRSHASVYTAFLS